MRRRHQQPAAADALRHRGSRAARRTRHSLDGGPVLDEDALVDTLREKRISTAAIDVYDIEPLPADHPLRTLPNALLTGHIAYVTDDLYRTFYQDSVEDIAALQGGSTRSLDGLNRRHLLLKRCAARKD